MLSGLMLAATAVALLAETPVDASVNMESITVEAAKLPMSDADIPSHISLISSDRIDRELAQSIQDLVRYEPGVNVVDQGSRFGLSGISIRGVGGNRVKIEVDGVATSDAFSIGSFSNASRDFVDVDALKQVEIIRGPASAVFGSDALGGVVSFITKGPEDLLGNADQHFNISVGYNSVDESNLVRAAGALRAGNVAAMLRATVRHGAQRDVAAADPVDDQSVNLLARLDWGEAGNGALSMTLERFTAEALTNVDSLETQQDFSAAFGFPFVIDTTEVSGDDRRERLRFSVGQEWLNGKLGADYLRWRVYSQDSKTRQDTFEARETLSGDASASVVRDRTFSFDQKLLGLEVNAANNFELGRTAHQIAYGVEVERTDTEQLRDGVETNLVSGVSSNQVGPDLFPVRDFPESRTRRTGVYLQHRAELGALTITPGVRWDRYELNPTADDIFAADNPGIETAPLDVDRWSPKLGLLWRFNEHLAGYAQYSAGFRAPPVNDVNVGFTNFQFGYITLPNPDLKSESSAGFEAGLRFSSPSIAWEVAGFQSEYEDFIESFQVVGFDPINQLLQFQSINVEEVEIRGAEFKARYRLPVLADQLSLGVSLAYAEGKNELTGAPLNSIAPFNGALGLDFNAADGKWGMSVMARGASRQRDLDESAGELFSPAGFVVYDTFGYWQPRNEIRLRAGVYNLANRSYTQYLDVQGQGPDAPGLGRFQRPGRHFSVALDWTH